MIRCLLLLGAAGCCLMAEELDLPEGMEVDPAESPVGYLKLTANRKFNQEVLVAQANFRARLADILAHADAVEIFLLDPGIGEELPKGQEDKFFPIRPYGHFVKIIERRRLVGEPFEACRRATAELLRVREDSGGAFCHYPIHGVRFLRGDEVVYESSFCWLCQNYYVKFPSDEDGRASWVGIGNEALKGFLNKELPIPREILQRFDPAAKEKQQVPK
jgi:hypothetical protein